MGRRKQRLAAEPKRVLDGRAGGSVRRKRKTKYQWLTPTGTVGPSGSAKDFLNGRDFGSITLATNGSSVVSVVDLLTDTPSDDETTRVLPMGVYTNNEYFIKRIVGKFFVGNFPQANDSPAVLVGAGIFIARAGDADASAGTENFPLGMASAVAFFGTDAQGVLNFSPLSTEAIQEPWIWRRTWLLGNSSSTSGNGITKAWPTTNTGYGSVLDGPHIDAKTARRVKDGERLFACVAAKPWPINSTSDNAASITAYIDYRVLGAPRRGRNHSAF